MSDEVTNEGARLKALRLSLPSPWKGRALSQESFAQSLGGGFSRANINNQERAMAISDDVRAAIKKLYPEEYLRNFGAVPTRSPTAVMLDFRDGPDWEGLFRGAHEIDLFFSGAAHWREFCSSYLDDALARQNRPTIRVVLPDLLQPTVMQLGERYGLTEPFVKRCVADAYRDFLIRGVDVWVTDVPPRYAMYRFDNQMVVTLYNQQRKHTPEVPTLVMNDNDEFRWFQNDFEKTLKLGTDKVHRLDHEIGLQTVYRVLTTTVEGIWRLPPRGKLLKAFAAIADGRISDATATGAIVRSSTNKEYVVRYDEDRRAIDSNDGGSFFVGYLNYPMIAYLISREILPLDKKICRWFRGLRFDRLSRRFHKDYEQIERHILVEAGHGDEVSVSKVNRYIAQIYEGLDRLALERLPTLNLPRLEWANEYERLEGQFPLF